MLFKSIDKEHKKERLRELRYIREYAPKREWKEIDAQIKKIESELH